MTKEQLAAIDPAEREKLLVSVFQWIRENGGRLPFEAYKERVKTWHTPFVDVAVVQVAGPLRVLVEKRPETGYVYPGMYDIPGGNFDYRETAEAAAKKVAEKLGFSGQPNYVGLVTYTQTDPEVGMSLLFTLTVSLNEKTPEGCQFVSSDELEKIDLVPWQKATYPDMVRQYYWYDKSAQFLEYLGK